MSRTTITLPNSLLDELMSEIEAKSKTEAVIKAIKDEIRTKKMEKIKTMAGKMEFTKSAKNSGMKMKDSDRILVDTSAWIEFFRKKTLTIRLFWN